METKLIPTNINMNMKKNMEEHSTIYYDIEGLVLRRGQTFSFLITFNKDYYADKYHLEIIFKSQTWTNLPDITIPLNSSSNGWSAKQISTDDEKNNQISFQINSPSHAVIGKYSVLLSICSIENHIINKQDLSIFLFETDIYFLFNPWNKTDVCGLLSSSDQIAEYVMNEHGEIYLGSSDIPQSIPWYFGQFERVVLLTTLTLLSKIQLSEKDLIDSSLILRILSSKICSDPNTNNGIFPSLFNIHSPSIQQNKYTSSPAILKQYFSLDNQSDENDSGSNWQHAAVFCSLCRSLGIPCRIVTVYNAAYQVEEKENMNTDWNTGQRMVTVINSKITCPWYLWNECWLRRDDLPELHSGWQVIDSSSIQDDTRTRRIGPCSVSALKFGRFDLKWDTQEIYGILNGNKTCWLVYPNGNKKLIDIKEDVLNIKILTKSLIDDHEWEDITDNYKIIKKIDELSPNDDVHISLETPKSIKFGQSLDVTLVATNLTAEHRALTVALALLRNDLINLPNSIVNSNNQTSSHARHVPQNTDRSINKRGSQIPIQSFVRSYHLDPNHYKTIQIKMPENGQRWNGRFDSLLKLHINVIIKETGQIFQEEKYVLNEEDGMIKMFLGNDVVNIGTPVKLHIQIDNSLLEKCDNGRITIDGFGISESISIKPTASQGKLTLICLEIFPLRLGLGHIYVTFSTNHICPSPHSFLLHVIDSSSINTDQSHLPTLQPTTTANDYHTTDILKTLTNQEPLLQMNKNLFDLQPSQTINTFKSKTDIPEAITDHSHVQGSNDVPKTTETFNTPNITFPEESITTQNVKQISNNGDTSSTPLGSTSSTNATERQPTVIHNSQVPNPIDYSTLHQPLADIPRSKTKPDDTNQESKLAEHDVPSTGVIPTSPIQTQHEPTKEPQEGYSQTVDVSYPLITSTSPSTNTTPIESVLTTTPEKTKAEKLYPHDEVKASMTILQPDSREPKDTVPYTAAVPSSLETTQQVSLPEDTKKRQDISSHAVVQPQNTEIKEYPTKVEEKTILSSPTQPEADITHQFALTENTKKPTDMSSAVDVEPYITETKEYSTKSEDKTAHDSPTQPEVEITHVFAPTGEWRNVEDISSHAAALEHTSDATEPPTKTVSTTALQSPALPVVDTSHQFVGTEDSKKPEPVFQDTTTAQSIHYDKEHPIDTDIPTIQSTATLPVLEITHQLRPTEEQKIPEEESPYGKVPSLTTAVDEHIIKTENTTKDLTTTGSPVIDRTPQLPATEDSRKPDDVSMRATAALPITDVKEHSKEREETTTNSTFDLPVMKTTHEMPAMEELKKPQDAPIPAAAMLSTSDTKEHPKETEERIMFPSADVPAVNIIHQQPRVEESKKPEDVSTHTVEALPSTDVKQHSKVTQTASADSTAHPSMEEMSHQVPPADEFNKPENVSTGTAETISTTGTTEHPKKAEESETHPSSTLSVVEITQELPETEKSKKTEDAPTDTATVVRTTDFKEVGGKTEETTTHSSPSEISLETLPETISSQQKKEQDDTLYQVDSVKPPTESDANGTILDNKKRDDEKPLFTSPSVNVLGATGQAHVAEEIQKQEDTMGPVQWEAKHEEDKRHVTTNGDTTTPSAILSNPEKLEVELDENMELRKDEGIINEVNSTVSLSDDDANYDTAESGDELDQSMQSETSKTLTTTVVSNVQTSMDPLTSAEANKTDDSTAHSTLTQSTLEIDKQPTSIEETEKPELTMHRYTPPDNKMEMEQKPTTTQTLDKDADTAAPLAPIESLVDITEQVKEIEESKKAEDINQDQPMHSTMPEVTEQPLKTEPVDKQEDTAAPPAHIESLVDITEQVKEIEESKNSEDINKDEPVHSTVPEVTKQPSTTQAVHKEENVAAHQSPIASLVDITEQVKEIEGSKNSEDINEDQPAHSIMPEVTEQPSKTEPVDKQEDTAASPAHIESLVDITEQVKEIEESKNSEDIKKDEPVHSTVPEVTKQPSKTQAVHKEENVAAHQSPIESLVDITEQVKEIEESKNSEDINEDQPAHSIMPEITEQPSKTEPVDKQEDTAAPPAHIESLVDITEQVKEIEESKNSEDIKKDEPVHSTVPEVTEQPSKTQAVHKEENVAADQPPIESLVDITEQVKEIEESKTSEDINQDQPVHSIMPEITEQPSKTEPVDKQKDTAAPPAHIESLVDITEQVKEIEESKNSEDINKDEPVHSTVPEVTKQPSTTQAVHKEENVAVHQPPIESLVDIIEQEKEIEDNEKFEDINQDQPVHSTMREVTEQPSTTQSVGKEENTTAHDAPAEHLVKSTEQVNRIPENMETEGSILRYPVSEMAEVQEQVGDIAPQNAQIDTVLKITQEIVQPGESNMSYNVAPDAIAGQERAESSLNESKNEEKEKLKVQAPPLGSVQSLIEITKGLAKTGGSEESVEPVLHPKAGHLGAFQSLMEITKGLANIGENKELEEASVHLEADHDMPVEDLTETLEDSMKIEENDELDNGFIDSLVAQIIAEAIELVEETKDAEKYTNTSIDSVPILPDADVIDSIVAQIIAEAIEFVTKTKDEEIYTITSVDSVPNLPDVSVAEHITKRKDSNESADTYPELALSENITPLTQHLAKHEDTSLHDVPTPLTADITQYLGKSEEIDQLKETSPNHVIFPTIDDTTQHQTNIQGMQEPGDSSTEVSQPHITTEYALQSEQIQEINKLEDPLPHHTSIPIVHDTTQHPMEIEEVKKPEYIPPLQHVVTENASQSERIEDIRKPTNTFLYSEQVPLDTETTKDVLRTKEINEPEDSSTHHTPIDSHTMTDQIPTETEDKKNSEDISSHGMVPTSDTLASLIPTLTEDNDKEGETTSHPEVLQLWMDVSQLPIVIEDNRKSQSISTQDGAVQSKINFAEKPTATEEDTVAQLNTIVSLMPTQIEDNKKSEDLSPSHEPIQSFNEITKHPTEVEDNHKQEDVSSRFAVLPSKTDDAHLATQTDETKKPDDTSFHITPYWQNAEVKVEFSKTENTEKPIEMENLIDGTRELNTGITQHFKEPEYTSGILSVNRKSELQSVEQSSKTKDENSVEDILRHTIFRSEITQNWTPFEETTMPLKATDQPDVPLEPMNEIIYQVTTTDHTEITPDMTEDTEEYTGLESDLSNIPDYLLWSTGNFILFFVLGFICIILSVRVRQLQHNNGYDRTLGSSQRTLIMNIFTTVIGLVLLYYAWFSS